MKDTRTNLQQNKANIYKACLISVYQKRNELSPYELTKEITQLDATAHWMHSADEKPIDWAQQTAAAFYRGAVIDDKFTDQFNQDFTKALNWLVKLRPSLKEAA